MKLLDNFVDSYVANANKGLMGKLLYSNLNQKNFKFFIKCQLIGIFTCLIPAVFFYSQFPLALFILGMSGFIFAFGILGIYSETWRYKVLNTHNSFENTIYILYFFIYLGLFGGVPCGWLCVEIIFSTH